MTDLIKKSVSLQLTHQMSALFNLYQSAKRGNDESSQRRGLKGIKEEYKNARLSWYVICQINAAEKNNWRAVEVLAL